MRRFRFVALLLLPFASTLCAAAETAAPATVQPDDGPILVLNHADQVEYKERERLVHLSGNVKLVFEDNSIQADDIVLDLGRNLILAEGSLVWEGDEMRAVGSRMTFNTSTREGWVEDVSLTTGSWICRGKRVNRSGEGEINVQPGIITTCSLDHPHWHIYSSKIRVRIKKDLLARNVTLYAGSTPVLWLPALATPLREFRLPFEAQVGKTQELGPYIRTSPSFSFHPRLPSQVHIDYFGNKGWGLGFTQEAEDGEGRRMGRLHAYRINERGIPNPGIPSQRWEISADGGFRFGKGTSLAGRADFLSDAYFRELYGRTTSPVASAAGERHGAILLNQRFPGANASVRLERTETRRIGLESSTRYVLSEIHAPQVTVSTIPLALADWLSVSARTSYDHGYRWQDSWYVNATSITPSLEGFWRIPVMGTLTTTPRFTGTYRDRGSRVLLLSSTTFREDDNRGAMWSGENGASLRTTLARGVELETSHFISRRFNKWGYDPFGYRGLDAHRVTERLSASAGTVASASIRTGYDLRNKQDVKLRRWMPVTPELSVTPHPVASISADADYDLYYGRFRRAGGTLGLGRAGGSWYARVRPSYTNNRLGLTEAVRTSQDYRMAEYLYAESFQTSLAFPDLYYLDAEMGFPILPRLRAVAMGQYDFQLKQLNYCTVSLIRDLHCWEAEADFHLYVTGEYRVNLSLRLKAFPKETIPLIAL